MKPIKGPSIINNFDLTHLNTFGLNVKAKNFVEVTSDQDLQYLLESHLFDRNLLILGGGSNILFTKDFDGLVILNSIKGIELASEDRGYYYVKSYSGELWHNLVLYCIENNYAGIENLSLIPGTVGAAPIQNIGAYGVELKDTFVQLEAIDLASSESIVFDHKDCNFGYRDSVFKHSLKNKLFITSITLRLNKSPVFKTSYGAVKQTLEQMGVQELSIKAVSDAVIHIRKSKLPDPEEIGNAGSFFKNPEISSLQFNTLKERFPNLPGFQVSNAKVKVPAGWLIEETGWKGKRVGNTGCHKAQSLVIVNYGNATGKEILDLASQIRSSVQDKFGIIIEPEVNII